MSFCVCHSAFATLRRPFQRFIDQVLRGLPYCYAYIDDLLIASNSPEEHKEHLRQVLDRLSEHGIIINHSKCKFGVKELNFLGHRVNSQGIQPLPDRVKAVADFPTPTSLRKLREFLGLVNFYHRFIPNCASILGPLNSLLAAKDHRLTWSEEATASFNSIKESLTMATLLTHPKPFAPTCIMSDASDTAVGAVLQQHIDGVWHPISYFSKKLRPAETRYSTFDRELLAVYLAIKHFRHFVEGRDFHVATDHKPLTFALATASDNTLLDKSDTWTTSRSSRPTFAMSLGLTTQLPMPSLVMLYLHSRVHSHRQLTSKC